MARQPRICVPEIPLHIIQRGNNRQPCFYQEGDYKRYLRILRMANDRHHVALHAYALMTNHVHLLVTPENADSASKMMHLLGTTYVRTFNRVHDRTGTLWEGRFRSFPVTDERYLLACHRYIEMNPVSAGVATDPADYRWSSYKTNALGKVDPALKHRREYQELASTPLGRQRAYRHLFDPVLDKEFGNEFRAGSGLGSG